jgi:hypothetical protein
MGTGGKTTGMKGAIDIVRFQPLGEILLVVLAVGLVGYSIWRFTQAIADPDNQGKDLKGLTIRTGMAISGLFHSGLAYYAVSRLLDLQAGNGSSGGNSAESRTETLLSQPFGRWLVLAAACVLVGMAIAHIVKAFRETYAQYLEIPRSHWMALVHVISKIGLMARAAVYGIFAYFLYRVFDTFDPDRAMGLNEALDWLLGNAWGGWLLAGMAGGLIAFGAYSLVEVAHRRIDAPIHPS